MFIDGFLALGTPTGPGTFTEMAAPGYARQPISFRDAVNGVAFSSNAYTFGQGVRGATGRAIFDAPSGGNLLLVMPQPTPLAPGRLPWDQGDAGSLRLVFAALQPFPAGAAFIGTFFAAAVMGTCNDNYDVTNQSGIAPGSGTYSGTPVPQINTAVLTAGVALKITRGILAAQ